MQPAGANQSVIRFGAFELDPNGGQLRKSGLRMKLRPQAVAVLILLARRSGEVVSREAIQKELWKDGTIVDFDQGLNFCIRQIRTALGDDADSPRFIETIPRRGYRFLVPVTGSDAAPAVLIPESPVAPPSPGGRLRRVSYWISAAILVLAAGFAWYFWPTREPPVWRPVLLTSYPGSERNPALSPDGSRVAFSWDGLKQDNFDIYVKLISSGAPLRLTTSPADDLNPAWSPDGGAIAFLRDLGFHRSELLLIPELGGPERRLAEARTEFRLPSLAWSPDGRWLVISHREHEGEPHALFLVSAQTGDKRRLTTVPRMLFGDFAPAFSPDGRSLAFCRLAGFSTSDVHLLRLSRDLTAAGEPRRLSSGGRWATSPVWIGDGRRIAYLSADRPDSRSELRIATVSGSQSAEQVATTEDVSELSLGRHLVYSSKVFDSNIWRAEIRPPGVPLSVPERLISSTRDDGHCRYSPDGKRIAFKSGRSGSPEIWIADADGSNALPLTSFGGPLVGVMDWSPDGRQLAFHARPEGQADLFLIPASGGVPRRITTDPSDDVLPSYSHDGRRIYFSSRRSGRLGIWRMPAEGGEATLITQSEGGLLPLESRDGKTLFYCHELLEKGVWKIPAQGGMPERVTGPLRECGLAVTDDGIYYTPALDSLNRHSIQFFSFSTGQTHDVVVSDRPMGRLSVSPDQRFVLFVQLDQSGSDLMLIPDFIAR
jgi:Tol biopolymer transport system component/DNA-binding winged helix-turn-helix (wHTH) protein